MLRSSVRRASARATLILAALASMLALTVGAAPVAGASASVYYLPVGCWSGTATTTLGTTESVESHFYLNGKFEVSTPTGDFTGSWKSTGPRTFTYGFVRTLPGPGGVVIGTIDIKHSATFTAWNTYTSTGTATAYDLNGNVLFSGPVSSTGTRTL
ncbi:hypothetical protein [Parafrankia sp. EUN1f]|uniref:hypothetical protein n=1 Tax=Parafrankia sp. EUN1f TaxID=102897 RepID=UPI0001C4523B|nr:hypothetical protein [Parafrankia sp. EUN1f]EFC79184.1 hypothetical protein FrEUN1fDRAFT_7691 [Parafrankia sp. EUN1f]